MLITAVCPACDTSYKVQPTLRGKSLVCPNPRCKKVFIVPREDPPVPANGPRSGLVGEVVPLVDAKPAEAPAPAPQPAPNWREPPPVRRPTSAAPQARPTAAPAVKDAPRELPPGTWEPPPVRRGQAARGASGVPETPEAATSPSAENPAPDVLEEVSEDYAPPPRKRTGLIVAALVLGVVAIIGVGGLAVYWAMSRTEGAMSAEAEAQYKQSKFTQARDLYKELQDHFPNSDKRDVYRVMQRLSELRATAAAPEPDLNGVLDQLFAFLDADKDQDALKDHAADLGDVVGRLADEFARANADPKDEGPLPVADRLEQALARLTALNPAVPSSELQGRVTKDLGGVRDRVAHVMRINAAVARIKKAADTHPTSKAVRDFLAQLRKEQLNEPGIADIPEVRDLRTALYAKHLDDIVYQPKPMDLPRSPRDNDEASFIVDPVLRGSPGKGPPDDPVVLSVARGVLYAMRRTNGQTKWAVRVGVDATSLPVRVPEAEGVPERILVVRQLSAKEAVLDALDADGARLWRYRMGSECIGRPLVVGNVAYLPTYDGNVHEIELAQGKLLGIYPLGQPLTVGGALDPATGLLYFPADDFCVYVIDPARHKCIDALYTGHSAGSIHGEPLIVTPDPQLGESWLVLNETRGLDAMQLRVYKLPLRDREEPPEKLAQEPVVPGWTWFAPFQDGEKLALLGDDGILGLFGIRQERNPNDPPLFPMLPKSLDLGAGSGRKSRGRAEVVEMQGADFWLLADGELKRMALTLNAAQGPQMTPAAGWDPPPLGSPLHASQVETDPARGGVTLILTTQPLTRQTCLATAVDDRSGDILWQRQLGFLCQSEPLELQAPGAAGPPLLLALDRGGGLFLFDPARHAKLGDGGWHDGGQLLFPPVDDGPGDPPTLLPGADGHSAYEIASPGDGLRLVVRRVELASDGLVKIERTIPLPAPLAGTPAVTETMMILPLADGVLGRVALPLEDKPTVVEGPNWRAKRLPPGARGRVTALGADTFLVSDAQRGLSVYRWSKPTMFSVLPEGKEAPTLPRKDGGTLTADPAPLPSVPNQPRQVCIADAAGVVTLLTVADDGVLKAGRTWDLGGAITAGPYVQTVAGATRIACVVDDKQLVWLDPAKDGVVWKHPVKPGADLVGRPRLVGGRVVVADQSGRIVGLDPKTGEAGPEYLLQGSAAAAAGPVGFGADRLFVPLTDGTVLLPKVERIR